LFSAPGSQVLIAGLAEAEARPAAAAVLREFDRLHRTYHAWKPSELSALNEAVAAGRRQPVTPEMAELIAEAQRLTRLSEQLFDPGIGRLVSLWGFQSDELPARLPEASALAAWQAARPSIVDLRLDGNYASSRQQQNWRSILAAISRGSRSTAQRASSRRRAYSTR
jgi:thiamine biosynthesis lipoprotein